MSRIGFTVSGDGRQKSSEAHNKGSGSAALESSVEAGCKQIICDGCVKQAKSQNSRHPCSRSFSASLIIRM